MFRKRVPVFGFRKATTPLKRMPLLLFQYEPTNGGKSNVDRANGQV